MESFETRLQNDLYQYLLGLDAVDTRLPECPDVEQKFDVLAQAYLADGIREFNDYPTASLGWMMYLGMAVAKYWDSEWTIYDRIDDLYGYIRDKRGYDCLDEYVLEDVLLLRGDERDSVENLVGECASRVYNALMREGLEPSTKEALLGYIACLRRLYMMGAAVQLKRMGYHMTKI